MIELKDLKPEDKGRIVVYKANHTTSKPQKGVITSWNDTYIFVDYYSNGKGTGTATMPKNLTFDKDDQMLTDISDKINEEQPKEEPKSVVE